MEAHMKHRGFTLIELLVTLSVMGVIGAMAMPNFMQARRSAMIAGETMYAHNVYKVANAYLAEDINITALPPGAEVCMGTYSVGEYKAGTAPASLSSCSISVVGGHASVTYAGLGGSKTLE